MSGQRQRQSQAPNRLDESGWIGDIAGGVQTVAEATGWDGLGAVAGLTNTTAGGIKDGGEANPWGFLGNAYGAMGGAYDMLGGDQSMVDTLGGLGNAFGAVNGFVGAADSSKSTGERLLDGADGAANALTLGGTLMGVNGLGASVAGGASTLGATGAGTALTGLGAGAAMASAGAVLGAGVAGVKAGLAINDVNNSDYARSSYYGQNESGQARTPYEVVQDGAMSVGSTVEDWTGNETAGLLAGGVTAGLGSLVAAPVGLGTAAVNWAGSWFD